MPIPQPAAARRLRIAAENRHIARTGTYRLPSGETISLPCNGAACAARTRLLMPVLPTPDCNTQSLDWRDFREAHDTVSCILRLRQAGVKDEILALNFANANVPGGGYLLGGNAQEESLCRASLLYAAIAPQHAFYRYHHLHPTPLYSDRMLYSPNVPLFRDASGNLLSTPQTASFLTCAAVNRRFARPLISEQTIRAAMRTRTAKIIAAAAELQPAWLILGAFGCGAFGNRRAEILPMFAEAIAAYHLKHCRIIFAIPS